jgi:hypothetical protein
MMDQKVIGVLCMHRRCTMQEQLLMLEMLHVHFLLASQLKHLTV